MIKNNLKNGFTDKKGIVYPKVLEYHFKTGEFFDLGKIIGSSHDDDVDEYGEGIGFYIFQDNDNHNIGYRIYREFNNKYDCDVQGNAPFIEKLQEKQDNVHKTIFPYGVVTLDNRVVGQIIPFYENPITLREIVRKNGWEQYDLYLECLSILKELCANGIYYYDLNPNNFFIINSTVRLIDFEKHQVEFDKPFSNKQQRVIHNFVTILDVLSNNELWNKYPILKEARSFDEVENIIKNIGKALC